MKNHIYTLVAIILLTFNLVQAQNAEKHLTRLVGEIDKEWLITTGETIPSNQVEYSPRKAPGFNAITSNAREQMVLNQPWIFFRNNEDKGISEPEEVQFPHQFERNRKYKSAWYLSKYRIKKEFGKRYFLKLSRIDLLSLVYVNGQKCGSHIGSYTPFEIDITDQLISGDNVFAILVYDKSGAVNGDRLITQVGPSRFKAGKQGYNYPGGIDDIPILEIRENTHIKDVFVKTSTRKKEIEIEYELSKTISGQ